MSEPRYYVVALNAFVDIGASRRTLTASVLDRLYCHREVARFSTPRGGGIPGLRHGATKAEQVAHTRERADAECARLNAEDEAA